MRTLSESELADANARSSRGDTSATMAIAEHHLAAGLRDDAKKYYVLAANQGSSVAANAAAVLYAENGENEQAVEWLRIACRAGNKASLHSLVNRIPRRPYGLEARQEKGG